MIWLTADLHLGHFKIMKYCHRPFTSTSEMDRVLIDNLNSCVQANDTLYILGDFSFGPMRPYRDRIKCKNIILIRGNHDRDLDRSCFSAVHDLLKIKVGMQKIILCHYAMRVWDCSHHSSWQLYGHSHSTLPDDPHTLSMDVGVDGHDYFPWNTEQIAEKMQKKDFKPIDHYGNR